jgi:hypothetical protein
VLSRIPLFLAAAAFALAATGCSSLTRPDEIVIGPEPAPVPTIRELPKLPGAAAPGAAAAAGAAPHQGG